MMLYTLSVDQFKQNMFVENGTKIRHAPGKKFKLFPFPANNNIAPVKDLNSTIGAFLCQIRKIEPVSITMTELFSKISEDTEIEVGREEMFYEIIRQLFFLHNEEIRPLNLELMYRISCKETSEKKIAEYLVDVLGNNNKLKAILEEKESKLEQSGNVLERMVISKLEFRQLQDSDELPYFQIVTSLRKTFEVDFNYILSNQNRLREYFTQLIEFYYFTYTSQTCLQLNRFLNGSRSETIPLYFCLDWEKTSQSRKCFSEGWSKLQKAIDCSFAHAIVLEIINQTETDDFQIDYIGINKLIEENNSNDYLISTMIDQLTDTYRDSITDCAEMNEVVKEDLPSGMTASSLKFLFDSVKTQFENTGRRRPYTAYADKFKSFCFKFLKNRGRSGMMLNITEETLIFLTKIAIKDQNQMRLKDVFREFEMRGVFFDDSTKEQVAAYYERLNLIEKKSDSGDAKYVKRIL